MVNNTEYFNSISFNRTDVNAIPPPSSTVVYSKTNRGWSVRDMPPDCIVPKGKIPLTDHSYKNLTPVELNSGKYVNQKYLSTARRTIKDEEDIDFAELVNVDSTISEEEKQKADDIIDKLAEEHSTESPEEKEEEPEEEEPKEEDEEPEEEKTPEKIYYNKFKKIMKSKPDDEIKKLYYSFKMN